MTKFPESDNYCSFAYFKYFRLMLINDIKKIN